MEHQSMKATWAAITRPTLIVDEMRARRNIARMAQKARKNGVRFRPHFKTHQSAALGEWFRDEGVRCITVSSVTMAAYFAAHGWDDITIAFPVNWREIDHINRLAGQVRLGLLVDSVETAHFLGGRLTHPCDAWLDVDTGQHRTGVDWADAETAAAIASALRVTRATLRGLLTHAGHSYAEHTPGGVRELYDEMLSRMESLRATLASAGWTGLLLSPGDTPTCSLVDDLSAADEIRPGNFPYYDIMQVEIGACTLDDVAALVACPVVSQYPSRGQVVLYGGGVHLSKESILDQRGRRSFGRIAVPTAETWSPLSEESYVASLSQEHGVAQVADDELAALQVGDLALILPVHSCMSADLLKGGILIPSGRPFEMMSYVT